MLKSIHCEKFRKNPIEFKKGLNVVTGDSKATNSIGKSTALMLVDYAFGGSDFLRHNKDVVDELGHHKYFFTFSFGIEEFVFMRDTGEPDFVYESNAQLFDGEPLKVSEYTSFLHDKYLFESEESSLRATLGLFARVWGRDNLNPHRPLEAHRKNKVVDELHRILKLYNRYFNVEGLKGDLNALEKEKSALNAAQRTQLIPKILKTKFDENNELLEESRKEIDEIKEELGKFATNIKEITSREVRDIKERKDHLLDKKLAIDARLRRINNSIKGNSFVKSKSFERLQEYFTNIDEDRFKQVEAFHAGVTIALRSELKGTKMELVALLESLESEIKVLDRELAQHLGDVENPDVIVDRVYKIAERTSAATMENSFREKGIKLKEKIDETKGELLDVYKKELAGVQLKLNTAIEKVSTNVYGSDQKPPRINFVDENYIYETFEDTGTGKAYSGLILFDLAVFNTANVPALVHDSVLFKNIQNQAVANLIGIYNQDKERQIFIAIDEVEKYGPDTVEIVEEKTVIKLSDSEVLYNKDWRTNS